MKPETRRSSINLFERYTLAQIADIAHYAVMRYLRSKIGKIAFAVALSAPALSGCVNDTMWTDSRLKPLESSPQFADNTSARPPVADTVARGFAQTDTALYAGRVQIPARPLVTTFPFPITAERLDRGEQRYNIYCSPCHGPTGDGNGMIVQRGFPSPPSYYTDRLRSAPVGHLYDVITNGYGVMYSYSDRVQTEDRWAIVAYIRALQATRPTTTLTARPAPGEQTQARAKR